MQAGQRTGWGRRDEGARAEEVWAASVSTPGRRARERLPCSPSKGRLARGGRRRLPSASRSACARSASAPSRSGSRWPRAAGGQSACRPPRMRPVEREERSGRVSNPSEAGLARGRERDVLDGEVDDGEVDRDARVVGEPHLGSCPPPWCTRGRASTCWPPSRRPWWGSCRQRRSNIACR